MYSSDSIVSKFMSQKLREVKGEIHKFTLIFGDTSTSFSVIDRSSRQKIIQNVVELISTISQLDLIDIYGMLLHKAEYAFNSNSHGTLTKIEHVLAHETQLKFKRIEIVKNIFSNHTGIKLEINTRKVAQTIPKDNWTSPVMEMKQCNFK